MEKGERIGTIQIKKRYRETFLVLCLIALLCACEKKAAEKSADVEKNEETTQETVTEGESIKPVTPEEILQYSNDVITWGPGIQTGEDHRPVAPVAFQEKYKNLWAEFIRENEKVIYLTFDEGYENGYTGVILDILKEKNVSAVFFVTMPYAREETELLNRMVEEGHVIGNHSVSHPASGMPSLSVEEQIGEIKELHAFIAEQYGYEMYLFRPPAGIFSEQSLAVTASLGYRTVLWSFAYADWDPQKQMSKATALDKMINRLHPGAIYLLHAVSSTNAAVLGEFIDAARSEGYQFLKFE